MAATSPARPSLPTFGAPTVSATVGGRPQWQVRFTCGPKKLQQARSEHREWLSLIESRIANIRAERTGGGQMLTPRAARALAAEWYRWFVAKSSANGWSRDQWRTYRDRMWQGLHSIAEGFDGHPLEHADTHSTCAP